MLDNFNSLHTPVVEECLTTARNHESRVIIVCQDLKALGQVIESQVDFILRQVEWAHNVWDLNAHNTHTNESFIVNIYPENVDWLLKEVKRLQQVVDHVKKLVQ